MKYISVNDAASAWGVKDYQVRKYCRAGRIPGAINEGKNWKIPITAQKPERKEANEQEVMPLYPLAKTLVRQMKKKNFHGLYDYVQVNLAYSSGRLASIRLTRDCTWDIYTKGKVKIGFEPMKVSDLIETLNHCYTFRYVLNNINEPLSEKFIREIHRRLTSGTVDERNDKVISGEYRSHQKRQPWHEDLSAAEISKRLKSLLSSYEAIEEKERRQLLDFHVRFERLAPFDDFNGRVGRLIMFKECLRHNVTPFILDDKRRTFYLEGIREWDHDSSILSDVVMDCQIRFEAQIELQRLREHGVMMEQAMWEAEDDD